MSATASRPAMGASSASLTAHYSPGQERRLDAYAVLAGTYTGALGGSLIALRASGRELPERFAPGDVILIGVATHKISRLVTRDKVTSFLRAPFTRFPGAERSRRGGGAAMWARHPPRARGELLVCPYCLAQWVATALAVGLIAAPRLTRLVGTIFVAHTISDSLQIAYRAALPE